MSPQTFLKWRMFTAAFVVVVSAASCKSSAPSDDAKAPSKTELKGPEKQRPPAQSRDTEGAAQARSGAKPDHKVVDKGFRLLTGEPLQHWYGVYMGSQKVGHATMTWRPAKTSEPGAWTADTSVTMVIKGRGNSATMKVEERRYYAGIAPYRLVASTLSQQTGGIRDFREAKLEAGAWAIAREVDGRKQPGSRIEPPRESLRELAKSVPRRLDTLTVGETSTAYTFNWQTMKEEKASVRIEGLETMMHSGVKTRVATVSVTLESIPVPMSSKVAAPGVMLEMTLGPGLKMKLEEKSVAQGNVVGLDVLGSGVPSNKKLGDPKDVTALRLVVKQPESFKFPSSTTQRVTTKGGRTTIAISRGPSDPVTAEDRTQAVKADPLMDAGHPAIRAKAAELLKGASSDAEKVHRIMTFVYDSLDKRLATNLPTASTVLEEKVGDCTEHTWLFVALARAAAIPARPIYGLAYIGDSYQSFGYHAWAEVALDGRWVAVDPTWNQKVADATHLRLGNELHAIAGVIGDLEIEVMDVKR